MTSFQIYMSLVVMALIVWSELILIWLYRLRIPVFKKLSKNSKIISKESYPIFAIRTADNYNHLMEQPTLFYPLSLLIIFFNFESDLNITLVSTYVVLRILHSLYQINFNHIPYRFLFFLLSSLCLIILSINIVLELVDKL